MDDNQKKDGYYHHFTYGKIPSEREREEERSRYADRAQQEPERVTNVEVTPPRELRTFPMTQTYPQQSQSQLQSPARTGASWSYSESKPPRKSGMRGVVASFLAGAIVVGGLMFASDRMDLFSGSDVFASGAGTTNGAAATAEGSAVEEGGTITAAIDVVRPNTIAELVEIASPAVVKIETYSRQQTLRRGSIFDQFFGTPETPRSEQGGGDLVLSGSGSGFFFDQAGYILTNEHVINGAEEVRVIVEGVKEPYVAKVLGTAYDLDLAVLKVEGDGDFPVLPLGSSEDIAVGDWVVAIGNPYQFDHTVTVGVLSAKERAIDIPDSDGTRRYQALLQTDASINPGNSGGPLLNLNGEVIGINTAVNAQAQGIGFAIPTSTIRDVIEPLKANQAIPRPYIGVSIGDVPEEFLDDLQLDDAKGAFVSQVMLGSPAYRAGVQMYDVIVAIDDEAVDTASDLTEIVGDKTPGDKVALKLIRNGQPMTVSVTIGDRNEQVRQ